MTRYERLIENIEAIDNSRVQYGALRFVVGVINVLGWIIMLAPVLAYAVNYYRTGDVMSEVTTLIHIVSIIGGILIGIFTIAYAQILELLMDVRHDVYLARRFIRRFGLYFATKPED